MNYDLTLMSKANQAVSRPLPPDIREVREHMGASESTTLRLRIAISGWLVQVAERIAPRPVKAEHDELFDAIAALLAEPVGECARLESASHRGC